MYFVFLIRVVLLQSQPYSEGKPWNWQPSMPFSHFAHAPELNLYLNLLEMRKLLTEYELLFTSEFAYLKT